MKKKGILWSKWKVAKTIWPYPEGYGVYREHLLNGHREILDTGIPKERAEETAKELNSKKPVEA